MSKMPANINKFFYLLLLVMLSTVSSGQDTGVNLKDKITEAIGDLAAEGYADGELIFRNGEHQSEISIISAGIIDSSGSVGGVLLFSDDSLSGNLKVSCYNEAVYLDLFASFSNDSLSGRGDLSGICADGRFILSGVQNGKGGYDLTVDLTLQNLDLKGSLERLSRVYTVISQKLKDISTSLGFDNFVLKVTADSGIRYRSNDMECSVSLKGLIGSRDDSGLIITIEEGGFWKYGKKFKIIEGIADLGTGEVSLSGESAVEAYVTTKDSGSVRREFIISVNYSGSIDDSIRCSISSDPALAEEQIINLLIRGSIERVNVFKISGSNIEDRVKMAVRDYQSDKYTRFTERQVGRLVTFDRVVIEGNVFSSGSIFQASKSIYRGIDLIVRGTVGGAANQTVSFEYPLSNSIFLINETNQFGKTGLDLRYVVKFE